MLLSLLLLAAPLSAKLVIQGAQTTVVAYPSMRRCEIARRVLLAKWAEEDRRLSGAIANRGAYCIPG